MHSTDSNLLLPRIPTRTAVTLMLLAFLAFFVWDARDAGAERSTSLLHWHLFLTSFAVAAVAQVILWTVRPHWGAMSIWPIAVSVCFTGICVGMAVGTTNWTEWALSEWWQGWWTPVMVATQAEQMKRFLVEANRR
jgi:hypothetical protein